MKEIDRKEACKGVSPGEAVAFDAAIAGGITLDTLKAETAASTDFADFQARIAAL